jgi:hypothetical protein
MHMAIRLGRFKARAIAGSEQYGVSGRKETLTITIDLAVPALGQNVGTYLYFSQDSAAYSFERLRQLGWVGKDIRDLKGIESNEVEIDISEEEYQGKKRFKVEIVSGGKASPGQVLAKDAFAEKFSQLVASLPEDDIPF